MACCCAAPRASRDDDDDALDGGDGDDDDDQDDQDGTASVLHQRNGTKRAAPRAPLIHQPMNEAVRRHHL